jgi:capsular exopolysaccharide synthesis family protein
VTPSETPQAFDFRQAIAALRRRAGLIVLCVIVAGGSALAFSLLAEDEYSATASLLFRDPGFGQILGSEGAPATQDPEREAATNARLVSLDVIGDRTARSFNGKLDSAEVDDKVSVEPEGQSDLMSVTATDADPKFAARLATEFAENYVEFRQEAEQSKLIDARQSLEEDFAGLTPAEQETPQGRTLQEQITRFRTLGALQTGGVELVQPARVPEEPSSPKLIRNTVGGALLGLIVGLCLALFLERLSRRLERPADLEESFSLPILATVPNSKAIARGIAVNGRGSEELMLYELPPSEQESFRMLRTRLRYFNTEREIRSVVVTSASMGEGKSTVALNLALAAASTGSPTVLVEADLHDPHVAVRHGLSPTPGLSEVLTEQASLEEATNRIPVVSRVNGGSSDEHALDVIVGGERSPSPIELVESTQMQELVEKLTSRYELVVIDAPAATETADVLPLMKLVSGVIVVGQLGMTTREEAVHLREQFEKTNAPVLGVVANRVRGERV